MHDHGGVDPTDDRKDEAPAQAVNDDDEHWTGYPGEGGAQAYVVPARARYGATLAMLVLFAMLVALAYVSTAGR